MRGLVVSQAMDSLVLVFEKVQKRLDERVKDCHSVSDSCIMVVSVYDRTGE